jgi:hypothetical protein
MRFEGHSRGDRESWDMNERPILYLNTKGTLLLLFVFLLGVLLQSVA